MWSRTASSIPPSSVEAEAGGCGGYGTAPATVPACPSTISVAKTTPFALSSFSKDVPSLISTGIGIVATMTVGPASPSPNGAQLTESLSTLQDTCPQTSGWPTKAAACTGVSPSFTIGTGGTATADGGAIILGTFPPVSEYFLRRAYNDKFSQFACECEGQRLLHDRLQSNILLRASRSPTTSSPARSEATQYQM